MSSTNKNNTNTMTLYEHVAEMRSRLVFSLVTVFILFLFFFLFAEYLIAFLRVPLEQALPAQAKTLHFTSPLEVFLANLKVSFLASLIFSCPVWMYHFWKFIVPGLMHKERRYVFPFMLASIVLFFLGVLFCYLVILPFALEFLISVGMKVSTPIIKVSDYISLLIMLILGFGLVFEIPVILVLLGVMGLIDAQDLREYRKIVLIAIVLLAAVLTPPDPISQIGLAVPIYLMYEGSIVVISFLQKFNS